MRAHFLLTIAGLSALGVAHAASIVPDLSDLGTLPVHRVAAPLVAKAISAAQDSKSQAYVFAVNMDLPLTLNDGQWSRVGDLWRWRTRVQSQGAQTLSITFSNLRLPQGASLQIYDAAGQIVQGPYTHADENADGRFWTPVIYGGDAVIEALVPAAQRNALQVDVGTVNHGFRGFGKADAVVTPKAAGSCEIDVVCPTGNAWPNEIKAVARITISGNTLCTGQMLNSVPQDDRPLFLTAHHCGVTTATATSVVQYWNYQNSTCRADASRNGNGSLSQSQTGGGNTMVADDQNADVTLISLGNKPSSAFNVFYSGWNANGVAPTSGSVIHHPSGVEKSISLYNTPATPTTVTLCTSPLGTTGCAIAGGTTISAWNVTYSQGVTEPGSSGGGLWDQNHLLIGQLSGGNSSCSNATGNDYYGRFDVAYKKAPSPLKAALDPSNTGATTVSGKAQGGSSGTTTGGGTTTSGGTTPTTTTTTPAASSNSGGGGALNPLLLLGLLGLRALRRRKTHG
jgi:lysyl endopeptidase